MCTSIKLLLLAAVAISVIYAAPSGELPESLAAETEMTAAEAAPEADLQGSESFLEKKLKKQLKHGGFGYGFGMPYGGFGGFGGFPGYGFGYPPMGFGSPLYSGFSPLGYGGYGLGGYGLGGYGGFGGFGGYPLGFGF